MEYQEVEAIQARLQTVERRLRLTLMGWVVSFVILVLLGAAAQHATSQPTVLRARSLEVIDDAGRARIVLSADSVPGEPEAQPGVSGLWLLDAMGRPLASLSSAPNGYSSLSFNDPIRPLQFGTFSLDGLILSDTNGRGRIQLIPDGLSLWDKGRRMRILLALQSDGGAGLTIFDAMGLVRTALDVDHHERPGLGLFDRAGQTLFKAP